MAQPAQTWELPHRHVGRRLLCFDRVTSTNVLASGLDPGTAVLAAEQTAGRGQYGRSWLAPTGSAVLLSIALDPPPELRRPAIITAWAAVSVAETILKLIGIQAKIKWPNDLLIHGRKVCGVLIEQGRSVVAGIGLNLNQSHDEFAAANLPLAGSLASVSGKDFDVAEVAKLLLAELDREYDLLVSGELSALESCWKWRLGLLGRDVVAETFDGSMHRGRLRDCAFTGVTIEAVGGALTRLIPEQIKALGEHH